MQSVVMNFADYDAETGNVNIIRKYYSYFDMLPFGYGNFFPMICAVLTCVLLLLSVIYLFTGKYMILNIMMGTGIAALIISLLPIIFKSYTLIGLGITLLLAAELIFVGAMKKNERTEEKKEI